MSQRVRVAAMIGLLLLAAPGRTGELEERLRSFVSERASVARSDVILPSLTDFEVTADAPVEVRLSASPREDFAGSTPITVSLVSAGRELKRGSVSVRVRSGESVLVASRALPGGHRIGPGDIAARQGERAPVDAIGDRSLLIGRETSRSVAAGAPWRDTLVSDAPLVNRGELVRVRLLAGGLRIDGLARARQDGTAGERIRVLNVESRRELVGVVAADGAVHVAY